MALPVHLLCSSNCALGSIVPDMSAAETFLRSFRQFTARRGFLKKRISDNAKSFKSTVLDHPDVQQYFGGVKLEWLFNVEKAPGIFEEMVKSTKRCLKKTTGKATLTHDHRVGDHHN